MKKRELSYNGWANHATWLVSVWDFIPVFVDNYFENGDKPEDVDERDIEDYFMSIVEGDIPNTGIIADMLNASMSEIDWREIAGHVKEELQERILDEF